MKIFFAILLLLAPKFASGFLKAKGDAPFLKFETSLDILGGIAAQNNQVSLTNPDNQILNLPTQSLDSEFKPIFKFEQSQSGLTLSLKPYLRLYDSQFEFKSQTQNRKLSDYGFYEAYLRWELLKVIDLSFGKINSQWGPSELLSPSQFMFQGLLLRPEPFQSVAGQEMIQLQFTPKQNLSFCVQTELNPSGLQHTDQINAAPATSQGRILSKVDYSSRSGDFDLGVVIGEQGQVQKRIIVGSFAFFNYNPDAQIYYDVRHQRGSEKLHIASIQTLDQPFLTSDEPFTLGVLGHRYSFSNGIEWHIEYIGSDFGQSISQREFAFKTIKSNPNTLQLYQIFNDPVSALPGQNYIYNSLRWDSPSFLSSLFSASHIYLRSLHSIGDASAFINFALETSLSDHWAQSLAMIKTIGDNEAELNQSVDFYLSYYLKRSF